MFGLRAAAAPHPPQMKNGEHAQYYALLELFAFGSWADYKGRPHDTPDPPSSTPPCSQPTSSDFHP